MLKEAIAEAKTIKETAIASAKAALEEAFTPQLTAMFAEKLNELEEGDEVTEKVDEMYDTSELEEDFNLEEILAELEDANETYSIEEEGMETELEEDLMLEEMSDEEIEELVMKVIDDMITSGKLMAGEEDEEEGEMEDMEDMEDMGGEEEEGEEEEVESEEEVNIDELLAEILDEEAKSLNEAADWFIAMAEAAGVAPSTLAAALGAAIPLSGTAAAFFSSLRKGKKETSSSKEMEETIVELRNELNEVNLLNAKLLYTNKIFKAKNLTESEKIKVLNTFDKAETVKEVKLVYETINESFKASTKKSPIKESLGSASKTIAPATPKQPIIEVNDAFARMQRLAGIRK